MLSTLPSRNQEGSTAIEPDTIAEAWSVALSGVSDQTLFHATDKILQGATNGWFPNPAQLRQACDSVEAESSAGAVREVLRIEAESSEEARKRTISEGQARYDAQCAFASKQNEARQAALAKRLTVIDGGQSKPSGKQRVGASLSRVVADIQERKQKNEGGAA